MNRLQIYLEELQLPLKALFFGTFLIAIGNILGNPLINELIFIRSDFTLKLTQILLFTGGLILACFPYIVFVKLLYARSNDKNIVIVGLIAYVVFLIMVLFFAPSNLPANVYSKYLRVDISGNSYALMKTGILGLLGIYYIVKTIYKKPARQKNANFTRIYDAELMRLVYSLIIATVFGIAFAYIYPLAIKGIYSVINFVASDVSNPMSSFTYSAFERLMAVLNLDVFMREEMWFGALGGTWNSLDNITYIGDVNIWGAQLRDSVAVLGVGKAGRFTTVYYILNIFAVPAYLLALVTTVSNNKEKRQAIITVVLGSLLSMVSGMILPIEIVLLLTTPILYLIHIFFVGFFSAVLLGLGITVGFSYLGILSAAAPGNIMDLLSLSRNSIINVQVLSLVMIGIVAFVVYFYVTKFYYSRMAIDVLNVGSKDEEVQGFIDRVGGLENIAQLSSTPTKLTLTLVDADNINVSGLHRQGVTKIVQTRQGYILSFGAGSYMLQKEVNRLLALHNEAKEVNNEFE
jgi:maltose/glucose PTS system EIICB component